MGTKGGCWCCLSVCTYVCVVCGEGECWLCGEVRGVCVGSKREVMEHSKCKGTAKKSGHQSSEWALEE